MEDISDADETEEVNEEEAVKADTEAILFDLWELDSWSEDASPHVAAKQRSGSLLGSFYSNVSGSLHFNGRGFNSLLYSNVRRALEVDGNRSVKAQLALADDASQLFVTQNNVLVARSLSEEFEQPHKVLDVPSDPQPQWRHMTYSVEHRVLALVSSSGQFVVVNSRGRPVHQFQARDVGLAVDIAAVVFRDGTCEADGTARCPELLVLGFDGVLRRVHVPVVPHGPIHPTADNRACSEAAAPLNLFPYHHSVSCLAYSPVDGSLAIGGDDVDPADGTTSFSLSWWRLSDSEPYAELRQASKAESGHGRLATLFRSMRNRLLRVQNKALLVKLVFSASGRQLAGLDLAGTVSIWNTHSFAKTHSFGVDGLPPAGEVHDVAWWSEGALVVAKRNGQMAVWSTAGALLIARDEPISLEARPLVTSAKDGRFFVLECEEKTVRTPRFGIADAESDEDEDDEEARRKAAEAARLDALQPHRKYMSMSGLVWLLSMGLFSIDDELFPRKFTFGRRGGRQVTRRVYRLHCFKSTTPLELFHVKVAEKEFGVALALAKKYGLDTDLIYQTQWLDAEITKERIADYLDKINDREWVRLECQTRIPNNLRASKLLLEYGLKHSQSAPLAEDVLFKDSEEARLCLHRLIFLRFLDRLDTYNAIYKGEYNADEWPRFRERDLIEMAVSFARDENYHALQVLFTYHGADTLPYRRYILGMVPETAPPADYEHLLPELELDADAYKADELDNRERTWSEKSWRKAPDWVEAPVVLARLGLTVDESRNVKLLKLRHGGNSAGAPHKKDARPTAGLGPAVPADYDATYPILSAGLTEWYIRRAREIDARSGQVDHAVALLELGDRHDVENLERDLALLRLLATLVYECGLPDLRLEKLEVMPEYDRFELLLRDSTADTVVQNLKSRAAVLIAQDEENADPAYVPMLLRHLLRLSREGRIDVVRAVIHHSRPSPDLPPAERIIKDDEQLMEWALACVYENPKAGPWDVINQIFTCLPLRDRTAVHAARYEQLHDRVDAFDAHLTAAELLAKYNLAPPLKFFLGLGVDPERQESARQLIAKACLQAVQSKPPLASAQWTQLLQDLLVLQSRVFSFVPAKEVYAQYVQSVLKAGHFDLAKRQLSQLGTLEAERLVLDSAREYFNSAATVSDTAMAQASEALSILPPSPAVTAETHLINAVAMLASHGVALLPLQIRLHADRRELIRAALKADARAYKSPSSVQRLAGLLGVIPPGSKLPNPASHEVQLMVGQSAFEHRDFAAAYSIATALVQDGYTQVWELAVQLGSCPAFHTDGRLHMLSYAMARCPAEQLPDLMAVWHVLQGREALESVGIQHASSERQGALSEADEASAALQTLVKFKEVVTKLDASTGIATKKARLSAEVARHPFYAEDASAHDRFLSLYGSRTAAGAQSSRDDEMPTSAEISERLVRLYALAPKTPGAVPAVAAAQVDDWLLETARDLLARDRTAAVAHILALGKFTSCSALFDQWLAECADDPLQSEGVLSLAVYVHSLQLLSSRAADPAAVAVLQARPPSEIVAQVERDLRELRQGGLQVSAGDQALLEQLQRYQRMVFDSVVARDMKILDPSLDIARFAADADYKRRCVLRLARSANRDSLSMALRLARQSDDLPEWTVVYEHVDWLLTEREPSTDLRSAVQEHLPLLLQHWQDVLERVWRTIDRIPGTSHARLGAAYEIVDDCYGRAPADPPTPGAPPRAQVKQYGQILAGLPAIQPPIDCKALVETDGALSAVGAVLSEQNVFLIAKLAKKHPELRLQPAELFRRLVDNVVADPRLPVADRLSAAQQYLDRLTDEDLLSFVENLLVSSEVRAAPVSLRSAVVEAALKPLSARSAKPRRSARNKKEETTDKEPVDAAVERLQAIKAHIDMMSQLEYLRKQRRSLFEGLDAAAADRAQVNATLTEHLCLHRLPLPLLAHVLHCLAAARPEHGGGESKRATRQEPSAAASRAASKLVDSAATDALAPLASVQSPSSEDCAPPPPGAALAWPPRTPTDALGVLASVKEALMFVDDRPPLEPALLDEIRTSACGAFVAAVQRFARDAAHAVAARAAVLQLALSPTDSGSSLYAAGGRPEADDRKLLERLKVEHVVGASWGPGALQRIQEGGSVEDKQSQFEALLAATPPDRPQQLRHLAALLQVWRDLLPAAPAAAAPDAAAAAKKTRGAKAAETAPVEDPLHRCWMHLMEVGLERFPDPAGAADFLLELREGPARNSLTADEEDRLVALLDRQQPSLSLHFGLLSARKPVVDATVSKMLLLSKQQDASSPIVRPDRRLVELVLSRGLLPRLAHTAYFAHAAQYLAGHGVDTDDPALSMPYAVALMTQARLVEHAASLVLSVSSISPWSLLFGSASGQTLLRAYLDSQQKQLAARSKSTTAVERATAGAIDWRTVGDLCKQALELYNKEFR